LIDLFRRQQDRRSYACRAAGVHNQSDTIAGSRIGRVVPVTVDFWGSYISQHVALFDAPDN
jgi:hypothetical protein